MNVQFYSHDRISLSTFARSLRRRHGLPARRAQRRAATGPVAGHVAQFRQRADLFQRTADGPLCLRPRNHPFRSCEQLRAGVRHGRGEFRTPDGAVVPPLPRRNVHRDQGGLRHVAGALRQLGIAQIPHGEPRPEPAPHETRLRRRLLFPPPRPRDAP